MREQTESDFKVLINYTLKKGGSVLIPTFAIARTQEIMLLLDDIKPDCPIYLDGMGREVTDIFLRYQDLLRDKKLVEANKWIKRVRNRQMQMQIRDVQGIFITSGGMLNGGSYMNYIVKIINDRKSVIILPGHQAEGSPGHQLINYGTFNLRGKDIIVKSKVYNFNFSSHVDFKGICKIIDQVKPRYLIAQHGEPDAVEAVKQYALSIGIKAIAPHNGDTFSF
jgi:putative mRNA 3-end processing factor